MQCVVSKPHWAIADWIIGLATCVALAVCVLVTCDYLDRISLEKRQWLESLENQGRLLIVLNEEYGLWICVFRCAETKREFTGLQLSVCWYSRYKIQTCMSLTGLFVGMIDSVFCSMSEEELVSATPVVTMGGHVSDGDGFWALQKVAARRRLS